MAIWQYTLIIIPKNNFEENYALFDKQLITKYRKETFYFWKDIKVDLQNIAGKIDKVITRAVWSSANRIAWTSDNQPLDNDGDIFIKDDNVHSFSIRIDLRDGQNILRIANAIIKICDENELMLMNLRYEVFEAKIENIMQDISKSNGNSFLKDPIKFLEDLNN